MGRFIGKLGVVSVPAIGVGLDLDERVVRRHVAKLEAAGWLNREPWIWGEGSVVWLTNAGMDGVGLGGVRPFSAPPGATTISHSVRVGWSAARLERRGRAWAAARELAVDRDRWAIRTRCERGFTQQLPDLVTWLNPTAGPVALVVERGGRREDRQKWILEAWRDAIIAGTYAGVRYDCATTSVAHWIIRLAKKVGLAGPAFASVVQPSADEIIAVAPAADAPEDATGPEQVAGFETASPSHVAPLAASSPALASPPPLRPVLEPRPQADSEPSGDAAARQQRYDEIFGIGEVKRRRSWRR